MAQSLGEECCPWPAIQNILPDPWPIQPKEAPCRSVPPPRPMAIPSCLCCINCNFGPQGASWMCNPVRSLWDQLPLAPSTPTQHADHFTLSLWRLSHQRRWEKSVMLPQLTPVCSSSQVVLFLDRHIIDARSVNLTKGRIPGRRKDHAQPGSGIALGHISFCVPNCPVQDAS